MKPILLVFVSAYMCYVQGQQSCTTPNNKSGECKSIHTCEPLLALVNNPNRTPQDVDLLKKSSCGFNGNIPQVCCPISAPACFTPESAVGTCIGIYSCPRLANFLKPPITKENTNYVQASRCDGTEQYSVCCGPDNPPRITPGVCSPPTAALPNPANRCCGRDADSGNRIVGGNVTAVDQYPWLVLIEYIKNSQIKLLCGGALISGKYVLTAGHCVTGQVLSVGTPKNVRLGEYDTSNKGPDCIPVEGGGEDCTEDIVIIEIDQTIPHPDYDSRRGVSRNDIALIRMKEYAPYTDFIRPICLPTADITISPPSTLKLYAAGWGAVSESQSYSNVKLHVDLPYRSIEECQPAYTRRKVQLWSGQLCAGGVKGKDSCKGDSGGPLMFENKNVYELVGIVSFGPKPCGGENSPGVYTNVWEYIPWIRSHIRP